MNEDCDQYLETIMSKFYPRQPVLAPRPDTGEKMLARLMAVQCPSCAQDLELERNQVIPDADKEYEAAKQSLMRKAAETDSLDE